MFARRRVLADRAGEIVETGTDSFRSAKARYDARNRFWKLRFCVVGVFLLDLVIVLAVVASSWRSTSPLQAWFQPGFPADMLIVRNLGDDPIMATEIVLDGRYSSEGRAFLPGATGLQIEKAFRARDAAAPPRDYTPKRLLLRTADGAIKLKIDRAKAGE